ncbi:MAG: oligosaccharide flippase family protein [Desulfobacula sp.]|nr:oligosaccharide flippase family protein [Desulfobacula sp.]
MNISFFTDNFTKNVSAGIICRITGIIITVSTSILLARMLGPEQFGQYAFLITVAELLTIIALFGTPALILREVAAGISTKRYGRVRGVLAWTCRATTLMSLPFMLIAILLFYIWNSNAGGQLPFAVILAAASLLLIDALSRQEDSAIQGLGKIIPSQILSILVGSGFLLLFLIGANVIFPGCINLTNLLFFVVASMALALLFMQKKKKQYLPVDVTQSKAEYFSHEWLKSALPLLLVSSLLIINTRIDLIMLGYLRESSEVGVYRVAQRGGQLMLFGVMAVDSVINPLAAKAWAQKQKHMLQTVISKSIWLVLLFTLPLFAIYILMGQELINFVYGIEYKEAWLPLVILSCGYLSLAFLGRGGVVLTMSHFERYTAAAIGVGAGANIILNFILIPAYGILGAACATAMAVALRMFMEAYFAYKKTKIDTTIFAFLRHGGKK